MPTMNNPARPAPRKHYSCDLVRSVALSSPAARTVGVLVSSDDGNKYTSIHPVLAIRTTIVDVYRATDREPGRAPSHKGMVAEGWRYDCREVRDEFLVHTDDYGITDSNFAFDGSSNASYRVVPCPWPAEEDEARLAPVVAELWAEAREKEARYVAAQSTATP